MPLAGASILKQDGRVAGAAHDLVATGSWDARWPGRPLQKAGASGQ